MGRILGSVALLLALLPMRAERVLAQVRDPMIGGVAGFGGGVVMTLAIVVARAQIGGYYLDSASDLIHWQTTPLLVGPAAGIAFGLAGTEVLKGSIIGSTSGLAVGAAIGAGLGWAFTDEAEWPWAGGVMGSGVGLAVGGLIGAYTGWRKERDAPPDDGGDGPPMDFSVRIPL